MLVMLRLKYKSHELTQPQTDSGFFKYIDLILLRCLDDAHPIESGREDKEPILENFPYYSLENKDFLDEIRNCSPMIEVPNAPFVSMKANFNLNVYERNLLGNDEQIDPDLNLLNDNALDAQYADPNRSEE